MQGYFNKQAILWRVFNDEAVADGFDWLWWLDADANIVDVEFTLPWDQYEERDIILWGEEEHVIHPHPEKGESLSGAPDARAVRAQQGDPRSEFHVVVGAGMNAGVLLFRNSAISREFVTRWAQVGMKEWNRIQEVR